MKYVYASAFALEIIRYIDLLIAEGRYINNLQGSLRSLDKYLVANGLTQQVLDAETVSAWLKTKDAGSVTKAKHVSNVRGFGKYLASIGIEISCPESPVRRSDYVPYIFSDDEIARIITVADNFEAGALLTRSALVFPILLRLLYSCGMRLGEGISLRWKDVDLERGMLTIRQAKNKKQRLLPVDNSMTELLKDYKEMARSDGICGDYLFESNRKPGGPFVKSTFHAWFRKAMETAGIHYVRKSTWERGPCPHCLRHCFTLKSFLKSESEGRCFQDSAPFLAAYLGHESPKETEAYLSSNHSVYTQSHRRVDAALGHLFPEVSFDEE
jgi:integrase